MNSIALPAWFYKLPPVVVGCIAFFIGMHVLALIVVAYLHLNSKSSLGSKAKFK